MHTPETRKTDLQTQKETYHQRKADGLCPHCGERKPYQTMVSCLPCRARHSRYSRHYNHRQREMRRQGLQKEVPDANAET